MRWSSTLLFLSLEVSWLLAFYPVYVRFCYTSVMSPMSFFQADREQRALLYDCIRGHIVTLRGCKTGSKVIWLLWVFILIGSHVANDPYAFSDRMVSSFAPRVLNVCWTAAFSALIMDTETAIRPNSCIILEHFLCYCYHRHLQASTSHFSSTLHSHRHHSSSSRILHSVHHHLLRLCMTQYLFMT